MRIWKFENLGKVLNEHNIYLGKNDKANCKNQKQLKSSEIEAGPPERTVASVCAFDPSQGFEEMYEYGRPQTILHPGPNCQETIKSKHINHFYICCTVL